MYNITIILSSLIFKRICTLSNASVMAHRAIRYFIFSQDECIELSSKLNLKKIAFFSITIN